MSTQRIHPKYLWIFILVVLLAACARATPEPTQPPATEVAVPPTEAPPPAGELTVLEWAGYEIPEMWADFGREHPSDQVTFNFGASDPDIYGKILAGSSED